MENYTLEELHGVVTTFELSKKGENLYEKYVSFKETQDIGEDLKFDEEAIFFRNLIKGSMKYKNNLPFKCLNYGRVWQYAIKCPFREDRKKLDDGEKNEIHKKLENPSRQGSIDMIYCTMESHSSEDE